MKYKVIRNCCWGEPKNRYWQEGTEVELDDNLKPPSHFVPIEGEVKQEKKKEEEPRTFSQIGTGVKPMNAGMAYDKNKDNQKNKGAGK